MALAERLLAVLQRAGALDDDQLGDELGVSRQSARAVALRLCDRGLVTRQNPSGGKWTTALVAGVIQVPGPPRRVAKPAPSKLSSEAVSMAVSALYGFTRGYPPKGRLITLEAGVEQRDIGEVARLLEDEKIDNDLLTSALVIKQLAGEINVVIHAVGILLALPQILDQPGERVISTSLGAGAGSKPFDLMTTNRIAEFKFTHWRGNDAVRQRELFADFVNLAESGDPRIKQLYVTGVERPKRFLFEGQASLTSVCARRPEILAKIERVHGSKFQKVAEYVNAAGGRVELVDLEPILSAFITNQIEVAELTSDELRIDEP